MPVSPIPLPMTRTAAAVTDVAVGIAAGLAAAAAMNLFRSVWSKSALSPPRRPSAPGEAVDALSEAISAKRATKDGRKTLAKAVHTAGAFVGSLYGLISGIVPAVTAGRGILFGAATWILGDELTVPRLGLGPEPAATDTRQHVYSLASHLVFGLTLDFIRRPLNRLISAQPLADQSSVAQP
jgi:putative membrane protein